MTRPLEILLIEDNDGDAFLISELLRDVGVPVNITVASDGQTALDILNKDKGHINCPHARRCRARSQPAECPRLRSAEKDEGLVLAAHLASRGHDRFPEHR